MSRRPRRRPVLGSPEALAWVIGRGGERSLAGPGGVPAGVALRANVSMSDWEAAVGARIAERAQPVEIDRGTLIVKVATSVWASELSLLATPILERLNARGLQIRGLRYRVGVIEPTVRPKAFRDSRAVPPPRPLPPQLASELEAVEDIELRDAIAAAAKANLAWQSYVEPVSTGATSATSRGARVPQSAERQTGRPDRTSGAAPGAPRRTP